MSDDEYISTQEASDLLHLSERSVLRYASGARPRIRTRKYTGSKRLFFHRGDVQALAEEIGAARRPLPEPREKPAMMPTGEVLQYLKSRDEELREAQRALAAAMAEMGHARGELERKRLIDTQLQEVASERDSLRSEITKLRARLVLERVVAVAVVLLLVVIVVAVYFYVAR